MRTTSLSFPLALSRALALVAVGGCGGPLRSVAPPAVPGTTTLSVENHVAPPGEVEQLFLAIDDVAVPVVTIPPAGAPPVAVSALRLAPGEHRLAVRAAARRMAGGALETRVSSTERAFLVGTAPVGLTLDVTDAGSEAASRPLSQAGQASAEGPALRLAVSARGAALAAELDGRPGGGAAGPCVALGPVERAVCLGAAELATATRERDVVRALCVRDRLEAMRAVAAVAGPGSSLPEELRAEADARVAHLSGSIERCAAGRLLDETERTASGPAAFPAR